MSRPTVLSGRPLGERYSEREGGERERDTERVSERVYAHCDNTVTGCTLSPSGLPHVDVDEVMMSRSPLRIHFLFLCNKLDSISRARNCCYCYSLFTVRYRAQHAAVVAVTRYPELWPNATCNLHLT